MRGNMYYQNTIDTFFLLSSAYTSIIFSSSLATTEKKGCIYQENFDSLILLKALKTKVKE